MLDLHNSLSRLQLLPGARVAATGNGIAVDLQGCTGVLKLMFESSAGGGTTPAMDVKIQECDTSNGTYSDVTGKAFAQVTDAAASSQEMALDTRAVKRFIRAVKTVTGTTPTFDCALVAVVRKQTV